MIEKITQIPVLEMLRDNALEHAKRSNGFFVVYDVDPNSPDFEFQQLHTATTRGDYRAVSTRTPIHHSLVHGVASQVDKRYSSLPVNAMHDQNLQITLRNMATLMCLKPDEEGGKQEFPHGLNIIVGTGHEELTDIAFGLAYISTRLHELNAPHRTGIVISKALDFIGIDTGILGFDEKTVDEFAMGLGLTVREDRSIHIRDFLGLIVDRSYMTIPDTPTFADLRGIYEAVVRGHTIGVLKQIWKDQELTKKTEIDPLLLAVATSGSVSKQLLNAEYLAKKESVNYSTIPPMPEINPTDYVEVAGRIAPGVIKMMKRGITFATGIKLETGGRSTIAINPEFIHVMDRDHLDIYARLLMEVLGKLADHTIILDNIGNLPVQRKA